MLVLFVGLSGTPAAAHEFWLRPDNFRPAPGDKVEINHINGQFFKGDALPFLGVWHSRYVVADAGGERLVEGDDGNLPAVTTRFDSPGLRIFGYLSTLNDITFDDWETFEKYLRFVGLVHIVERHLNQGKPKTGVRELYTRCAKLLLGVGAGNGADRALGLPLELIAERNPYTLKPGDALPVRLLYKGKPIAGVTVTAFSDADPKNPVKTKTDADGRALISLPAPGAYMLNAVHMFDANPEDEAHWKSYWSSMTFER